MFHRRRVDGDIGADGGGISSVSGGRADIHRDGLRAGDEEMPFQPTLRLLAFYFDSAGLVLLALAVLIEKGSLARIAGALAGLKVNPLLLGVIV